ncbi:MAG TPA: endonuclease/exonuclease/phosphatase family protein [Anaeromyxobacteraceae bacterium]|nr:endonuclease/exonuclease/phosphatase family protein [Anaeromyxobacteraceae bacterium]
MRPHLLLFSALCAASACAVPPPPSAARTPAHRAVRVASWNVHDLFDAVDEVSPPGDLDELRTVAEVEAKVARVAEVLARADADVVLLQEVETLPLARALAARAGYGEARLVEAFDPRGIDVAVLSRLAVEPYVSHLGEVGPDGRPLWSRDCVEAHVSVPPGELVVVGTHLVSRLTDPAGDRRRAQAARMREIVDGLVRLRPGTLVLAGGDLNDEPASAALSPLLGDGGWVDALDAFGLASTWTWLGLGGGRRLDYLLVPREDAWRVLGATVLDGPDVAAASDHRPVVVDLLWGR